MYNFTSNRLLTAMAVMGMLLTSCSKMSFNTNNLKNFETVNLVVDDRLYQGQIDGTLMNAWGLAWSPTGTAWVNAELYGVSDLFTGNGGIVRPGVYIPSPKDTMGGKPTGIVFNSTKGFILPNQSAASFIFVGVDGVVSAWNGSAGNKAFRIADNSATSSYTGLALASDNGRNLLYAANFKTGKIDVWDTSWAAVQLSFDDPGIPTGYAPFNIQAINSYLYVSYAMVGSNGKEAMTPGAGFVDIFNTDGSFVRRFASQGALNAPWGIAWAAKGWLSSTDIQKAVDNGNSVSSQNNKEVGPVILVSNIGDGRINVYSEEGQFLGALQSRNQPIVIDGLWAIGFAPSTATSIDPARLYFTAGPNKQIDGIFGYLIKD